jgi:hypothetical protein
MPFHLDPVTLVLLLFVLALVIGIGLYAIRASLAVRSEQRKKDAIRAVILDYFRRSGVEVAVGCGRLEKSDRFTAVVESEPMKRFRLSHIIEMTLREHVQKACGLELDKIYWRFPVKQTPQDAAAQTPEEASAEKERDDYINEGLEHYRHMPKPDVEELDWEQFEQAAIASLQKRDEAAGEAN